MKGFIQDSWFGGGNDAVSVGGEWVEVTFKLGCTFLSLFLFMLTLASGEQHLVEILAREVSYCTTEENLPPILCVGVYAYCTNVVFFTQVLIVAPRVLNTNPFDWRKGQQGRVCLLLPSFSSLERGWGHS